MYRWDDDAKMKMYKMVADWHGLYGAGIASTVSISGMVWLVIPKEHWKVD